MIRSGLRDQLGNTVSDRVDSTHVQFNEKAQSGNMCKVDYQAFFHVKVLREITADGSELPLP